METGKASLTLTCLRTRSRVTLVYPQLLATGSLLKNFSSSILVSSCLLILRFVLLLILTNISFSHLLEGIGGVLPTEIGQLVKLEVLDLSKNKKEGVEGSLGLSGGIPVEIGNLVELKILVLFENDLSGEYLNLLYVTHLLFDQLLNDVFILLSNLGVVPAEIGQLTELEVLHLKDNSFNVSSYFRYLLKIS